MRDKLVGRGSEDLADHELLEMLLFFVQPRGDTKSLAKALINRFGSYAQVLCASPRDLRGCQGLGPHTSGPEAGACLRGAAGASRGYQSARA